MIKINLALRKQSASVAASGTRTAMEGLTGISGSLKSGMKGMDSDALKDIVRKVALPIGFALVASHVVDMLQQDEIKKQDELIAKERTRQSALQAELAKTKVYDEKKRLLEADETTLRTKIETIQKLMDERTTPPKILIAVSGAIPPEVWLSEVNVAEDRISVLGYSLEFNHISDFMRNLGGSVYFSDISPPETRNVKDEAGREVYSFSLVAKRR
jgi:Tfp pilus assembly protein PilN